jgi:hypothetical protein
MLHYSIGADPEWFLKQGNKVVSAIGKIGGTKDKPIPIPGLGKGFFMQEDNVSLEYNIPPCRSVDQWVDAHCMASGALRELVLAPQKLLPYVKPSHSFDKAELQDPRSWVFGCEPDFDAWLLRINPRPNSNDPFLRSASGHIHVGCNALPKVEKIELVRLLDLFISIPLMLKDRDTKRRLLYGNPGAMRFKPYGLEYRTPSNYWTKNAKTVLLVAQALDSAFHCFNKKTIQLKDDEVRQTILQDDLTNAKTLIDKYGLPTL